MHSLFLHFFKEIILKIPGNKYIPKEYKKDKLKLINAFLIS